MLIEIKKKEQLFQFDAASDESLLFAGLRSGIPLPYECATGTCGTCRARLDQGEIEPGWVDAPGKKNHKPEKKDLLLCQAKSRSPCKLTVPAKIKPFRDDDYRPDYYRGELTHWQYLTDDVIQFEVLLPRPVQFHPGQFFVINVHEIIGYRAYSMVNFAPSLDRLEFIIKLKPGGGFSQWATERSQATKDTRSSVKLFGPLGRATFHQDEQFDLTMITGGSGIAGLMSILQHASDLNYLEHRKVKLFFGVRTLDDLFFSDRLIEIKNRFPQNIDLNVVLSMQEVENKFISKYPGIHFSSGLVHQRALESFSDDNSNTLIYMAGPQPMVDAAIKSLILEARFPMDKIRFDKFS